MSTAGKDTRYVICVGSTPEDVAALARALDGAAVVVAAADAGVVESLLASAVSMSDDTTHPGTEGLGAVGGPTEAPEAPTRCLTVGPLVIDRGLREVAVDGRIVDMSAREFDLLQLLACDTGKVWTFADIIEAVWDVEYLGDTDMLFSAVKRLRRRLAAVGGGVQVVSVRGIGFRLLVKEPENPVGERAQGSPVVESQGRPVRDKGALKVVGASA
ncbi:winged helix-turn-helix domain-containing protein [Galactobacter sp.]|uniref:winged helix-turn-helix domain-containing protein n=1 Tax=Galactobacter sp. TaxID=2676125 RepID=UPI0025BABA5B|nr:winged helix-turn-helix domain-containing protein [Galactobacter sp.]